MIDIHRKYCSGDNAVARFLTIYIAEAHARDEWWLSTAKDAQDGGKRCIYAHRSIEDRLRVAKKFVNEKSFPSELVCDSMEEHIAERYDAWPERLFIIQDGVIVYHGGAGPFGYSLNEVKEWLENKFGKTST